jgi:predicted branched-subunit amino acid permease
VWVPALKTRPQLAAALVAGAVALACVALPFRLGLVIASVVGIVAGAITLSRQR